MVISQSHWDALVAHARETAPNECGGYGRARDGRVEEVYRGKNVLETSQRFGFWLDSDSLFRAYELEEQGSEILVYHSHPASPAEPSQTDINLAKNPDWRFVIVSLTDEQAVRCWWIKDGRVEEEDVTVDR